MHAAVVCPSRVRRGPVTALGAGPLRPAAPAPRRRRVLAALGAALLAMPACAADHAAGAYAALASWSMPAIVAESDRAATAATGDLARRLLARFGLDTQPAGRLGLPGARWSLGVASHGPVRWLAGAYADERSRTWLSTGISWPLTVAVAANLAWSQPVGTMRQQRWTLGLSLDF